MQPLNLLALAGAPVVGTTYLVPCYWGTWGASDAQWWPMRQPAHEEPEGSGLWDWHLDSRFLTPDQEALADETEQANGTATSAYPEPAPDQRWKGSRASRQYTIVFLRSLDGPPPPAVFRPLECRRPTVSPEPLCVPWPELQCRFGDPALPIVTPAGRILCPHQKADLTYEPVSEDGIIVCPLHRLRVRAAVSLRRT
jgi:hypothetical protein